MTDYERQKAEVEFRYFTSKNFEKPSECRDPEQIRFYVQELCSKIEEYQERFNYVPNWAYGLLAQYNAKQNDMVSIDFKNAYH